jgi:hypothetical protein
MPTPFYSRSNCRILIPQPPSAPANFRSGVPASTASWVLEAFIRGPMSEGEDLPSTTARVRNLSGFITAYATLPTGATWTAAGSAFSWTTTGLAPEGLLPGLMGRAYLGDLSLLPLTPSPGQQGEATITSIGGRYGPGGIGAQLRRSTGDAIDLTLEIPG